MLSIYDIKYKSDLFIDGITYNSVIQYVLSEKARRYGDRVMYSAIRSTNDYRIMLKLEEQIQNVNEEDWKAVKYDYINYANYFKFANSIELLNRLLFDECDTYSDDPMINKSILDIKERLSVDIENEDSKTEENRLDKD